MPEKRVRVLGSVHVGQLLDLDRALDGERPSEKLVIRARQNDAFVNAERERWTAPLGNTGLEQQKYCYSLKPRDEELTIRNQGLCQSYGIFGIPGCGKSYLLMHLLGQLLAHEKGDADKRFGGLILDPKAALLDDIKELAKRVGRENDLVILNESSLAERRQSFNILDSFLSPANLGKALALAARSAGISSKEPYWLNQMGRLLGAGLLLLHLMADQIGRRPTLRDLMRLMLRDVAGDGLQAPVSRLSVYLKEAQRLAPRWCEDDQERFEGARSALSRHLTDPSNNRNTMNDFMEQAFGLFADPSMKCFSGEVPFSATTRSLYDAAIEEGKIIVVSVSRKSLAISKILCTLVKTLFQQTVLTRLDRVTDGSLSNFVRPLIFIADEYSDIATEVEGEPMGDSMFFSQMRQFGCMGIIATQSIHMLRQSSLGEGWKSLFSNLAAKIFMQAGDNETAEEASRLAGEGEFRFTTYDLSLSNGGASLGKKRDLRDRKELPPAILTTGLGRGQAVVIGATDGESKPSVQFVQVAARLGPKNESAENA